MKSFEKRVNSFVIRMWLEPREMERTDPEWRGRIEHVQSGERAYFRDLNKMVEFVVGNLDSGSEIPPLTIQGKRGVLRKLLRRLLPRGTSARK